MLPYRVIPVLLYDGSGLVKSVKFKDYKYVGDLLNAVKILNEKEVDELVLLDISATPTKHAPDLCLISDVASECFMPLAYGGGIGKLADIEAIFKVGVEKVVINSAAVEDANFIRQAVAVCGSQSIVVSIDVKREFLGKYNVYIHCGRRNTGLEPVEFARRMETLGVGEIILNSIDRDGTMQGYDVDLLKRVTSAIKIPVVACGGAGSLNDFAQAIQSGASAVAAGSMFVFYGKHRAVLINYPTRTELGQVFALGSKKIG